MTNEKLFDVDKLIFQSLNNSTFIYGWKFPRHMEQNVQETMNSLKERIDKNNDLESKINQLITKLESENREYEKRKADHREGWSKVLEENDQNPNKAYDTDDEAITMFDDQIRHNNYLIEQYKSLLGVKSN